MKIALMKNARRGSGTLSAGRPCFEVLISELSSTFTALSANDIDSAIESSLGQVSHSLQIDQIRVLEFSDDKSQLHVAHCWENPGFVSPPASFVSADFAWTLKTLASGRTVRARTIHHLPQCATHDKKAYTRLGVKSLAMIPLEVGRWVLGGMLFATVKAERVWSDELVSRLRLVSQIIANALKRKRIAGALRNSEELFQVMAETAPVMIWMSGMDRGCTHFNEKWLEFTGRFLQDELGDGWMCSVHPEDWQRCLAIYEDAFEACAGFRMEFRLRRFDGQYRWIIDSAAPRFHPDGSFAGFIGSCMDIHDSKDAEQAVRRLTGRLINAQEEERRRIARELHDDISQSLALLVIDLEEAAAIVPSTLHQLSNRAVEISKRVQAISHQLHSSQLELLGLASAVRNGCEEYTQRQHIKVHYKQGELPDGIPADISLCVFRVLQEALRNAAKHSGADRVHVELSGDGDEIRLSVRDDGRGFDPQSAVCTEGLGLISMRERLHLHGGCISIRSRPNHGTDLEVRVPLRRTGREEYEATTAA